jgi:hypothetical protein
LGFVGYSVYSQNISLSYSSFYEVHRGQELQNVQQNADVSH